MAHLTDRDPTYLRVLEAFGHYGFRKASMDDLARAAGVSRQTLYNRFGGKEGVLDWAIDGYVTQSEAAALAALDGKPADLASRLTGFFAQWLGSSVEFLRTAPHGAEIFELGKQARARLRPDPDEACTTALVAALEGEGRFGHEAAREAGYVMMMASKGLLLGARDTDAYAAGMRRVIGFLLAARV
ncbi:hypothetical protein AWH62_16100 [Maricaulis sp. W15]|uniref:TetR family transcriptional regulator n=1 Tax=Maricaulis maris TaxID=74318 RepID=A0A495DKU6_9PROT|nr:MULTISPECIES: TetR/AcrR family transcriptional regulator [Maricaulis]OLF78244.1 hypothetical protein AWH62_16100 [Maricaulis sp. W15]RKR03240.1 TetR family transcriptional regulator [Maricaulis maris]